MRSWEWAFLNLNVRVWSTNKRAGQQRICVFHEHAENKVSLTFERQMHSRGRAGVAMTTVDTQTQEKEGLCRLHSDDSQVNLLRPTKEVKRSWEQSTALTVAAEFPIYSTAAATPHSKPLTACKWAWCFFNTGSTGQCTSEENSIAKNV